MGLRYLANSRVVFQKDYVKSIKDSFKALKALRSNLDVWSAEIVTTTARDLQHYLKECEHSLATYENLLLQAARGSDDSCRSFAFEVNYAPRITPTFWLRYLNREHFNTLSDAWKRAVVEYALVILQVHRAQRLVGLSKKPIELAEELNHVGHTNWDPFEYPETLLLEVESHIMIREVQEIIAALLRTPPGGENAVFQLNMGQGKSSTIIPMVATYLADGHR